MLRFELVEIYSQACMRTRECINVLQLEKMKLQNSGSTRHQVAFYEAQVSKLRAEVITHIGYYYSHVYVLIVSLKQLHKYFCLWLIHVHKFILYNYEKHQVQKISQSYEKLRAKKQQGDRQADVNFKNVCLSVYNIYYNLFILHH